MDDTTVPFTHIPNRNILGDMSHEDPTKERRAFERDYKRRQKELALLIVQARKQSGMLQKTVAIMLGMKQPTVAKLEKSGRVPFVVLERLAAIYDLPLTYFTTLPADTRKDGKYMGMTNQEWAAYYKIYARPNRHRNGCRSEKFDLRKKAISIEDLSPWQRERFS